MRVFDVQLAHGRNMASLVTERSRHIRLGNVGLVNLNTEASIRVRPLYGPGLADRPTRPEHLANFCRTTPD